MQCPGCTVVVPRLQADAVHHCNCGWQMAVNAEGWIHHTPPAGKAPLADGIVTVTDLDPLGMDDEPEIESLPELDVLRLEPGDIVVIQDPEEQRGGRREFLRREWAARFPGHEVIYLDGGKTLGVLRRAAPLSVAALGGDMGSGQAAGRPGEGAVESLGPGY